MTRPKRAILSKNLIRDQALAIIDEAGLDGLTMRRLADRLGVQAASLYSHFANKEAVLDAIANRLARSVDPHGFEGTWQAGLRTWATSYYDVIHLHPNAAPILAAGSRARGDYLETSELIHEGLLRHGWPPRRATMAAASTKYLVLGATTSSLKDPEAHSVDPADDPHGRESFMVALESLIRGLTSTYEAEATELGAGGAAAAAHYDVSRD